MRNAWIEAVRSSSLALAFGGLAALAGCDVKETGPEPQDTTAAAPAVATPVPRITADPAAAKPLLSFAGMDTDGNGIVTSAENATASQAIFQAMNLDRDGSVTLVEMDAARAAIGRGPMISSEKLIGASDADHDGNLTLGEWVAESNARFARFDRNKDNSLTLAEWQEGMNEEMPLPPPAPEAPVPSAKAAEKR